MSRLSHETQAQRRELATQFNESLLDREVLTAADTEQGTERSDLLQLVAAARPDLDRRGEIVPFLDDARRGEGFRAVTVRERGSGVLVAAMWAERFKLGKHIPGGEAQKTFAEATARLGVDELAQEAYYASNATVHPDYRKRGIGRRAFAAALSDPAVFSEETAVFYRRGADNLAGMKIEGIIGAEPVLMDKNRSGGDRHLNMVIASPEIAYLSTR